jgi:hypothetical protein
MVGRTNSNAHNRRLVFGATVALALLVLVGRIQRNDLATPPTVAPGTTTTAHPLPVTATIQLGAAAAPPLSDQGQLMVGEAGLWAVVDGTLVRVDARSNSATARIRLGGADDFVRLLAVGAGAAWVATDAGVIRVDAATNRVGAALPGATLPQAAGAGSLWSVQCTSQDGPCRLLRVDPHSLGVLARYRRAGRRVRRALAATARHRRAAAGGPRSHLIRRGRHGPMCAPATTREVVGATFLSDHSWPKAWRPPMRPWLALRWGCSTPAEGPPGSSLWRRRRRPASLPATAASR